MKLSEMLKPYRIDKPEGFTLSKHDPADTAGLDISKKRAREILAQGIERLTDLQERLYADDRWSVLLIFQAMDAAGKDSVIKHVMSGINPQGCDVHSFKHPSAEELDHNFLWRHSTHLPERGRIGIFNRSYYEEVLVVRVHPEQLGNERMPKKLLNKKLWSDRFNDIRAFEHYLTRNGTLVLKFFLHVSKEEQRQRFLERLDTPSKNWKFSMNDLVERQHWSSYMAAYEDMIRNTSSPEAPWHVVPADHKWFTRLVVAAQLVESLERLKLEFPKISGATRRDLRSARKALHGKKE